MTVTRRGQVKRTELSEYSNARANGIIGTGLASEDEVTAALVTDGSGELILATRLGQAIRFSEEEVRPMGRGARGVRAIDLAPGDEVVSAVVPRRDSSFCLATRRGHGKRLPVTELRLQSRAGKGVSILPDRQRAGDLVGLVELHGNDRLVWELASGELVFSDGDRLKARARRAATLRVLREIDADAVVNAIHVAATGWSDVEDDGAETSVGGDEVSAERPAPSTGISLQAQLELAGDR